MGKAAIFLILLMGLTACEPAKSEYDTVSALPSSSQSEARILDDGFSVSQAYIRPPLPGRDIATAYFTLYLDAGADRLIAVSSPVSKRIELHTHIQDGDVIRMRQAEGYDFADDAPLVLQSGGHHLMMFETLLSDHTGPVPLTLTFQSGKSVAFAAPIGKPSGESVKTYGSDHRGHGSGE